MMLSDISMRGSYIYLLFNSYIYKYIFTYYIYIYSYIHINCTYDLPTNFSFFPLSRKSRIYFRPYRSVGRCRPKSWLFRHEFQPPYVKKQTRHRILHRIFQLISRSHGFCFFHVFFNRGVWFLIQSVMVCAQGTVNFTLFFPVIQFVFTLPGLIGASVATWRRDKSWCLDGIEMKIGSPLE